MCWYARLSPRNSHGWLVATRERLPPDLITNPRLHGSMLLITVNIENIIHVAYAVLITDVQDKLSDLMISNFESRLGTNEATEYYSFGSREELLNLEKQVEKLKSFVRSTQIYVGYRYVLC